MTISQADVKQTIREFLARANKPVDEMGPRTPLFTDGIGLDSLETAELSAVLEDEYGTDPFSSDSMPQTVGDIVDFYGVAVAGA
jgi:acyl carrier protein